MSKNIPKHIAIVMDGNRRWAKERGLNPFAGHKVVTEQVAQALIQHAGEMGVEYITLWAWSSENWDRPQKEVNGIMKLFRWSLKHKAQELINKGARLRIIGDTSKFPVDIQEGLNKMIEESEKNDGITVIFGLNYGGRNEIIRAINKVLEMGEKKSISEEEFSAYLDTQGIPDPDLWIRPGGKKRLSGLLPWQATYAELYFTDVLMPDFGPDELDKALADYAKRTRTYGAGDFTKL